MTSRVIFGSERKGDENESDADPFDSIRSVGDTFVKPQSGTPFYFEDFTSNSASPKMYINGDDFSKTNWKKAA